MSENFRKEAEEHWQFIKKMLQVSGYVYTIPDSYVELVHVLYVESMVHGFKHGRQIK